MGRQLKLIESRLTLISTSTVLTFSYHLEAAASYESRYDDVLIGKFLVLINHVTRNS
jgi:hypothetical protein